MVEDRVAVSAGMLPGPDGVAAGHAHRTGDGWLTGCTVVLPPPGTVGAVDVRGGAPGTRETDALAPSTLVATVDAVLLTGGSAFGLAAADGVVSWCESAGRGFEVVPAQDGRPAVRVPIVPAAVVFDLGRGGDPLARPDASFGLAAATAAASCLPSTGAAPASTGAAPANTGAPPAGSGGRGVARGSVGVGTGALVDGGRLRGGVGTASVTTPAGASVGALVVANAAGRPVGFRPPPDDTAGGTATAWSRNTTLAVVATDVPLSPGEASRLATAAHAGIARAVDPSHTLVDGDVVFALATGRGPAAGDLAARVAVEAAAATAVAEAFADAVGAAEAASTPFGTWPAASPAEGSPGSMEA